MSFSGIKYTVIAAWIAALLAGCTGYRTYNSLHWAKEAYKEGMRAKRDSERQARSRNLAFTRERLPGTIVPGSQNFEEAARKCLAFLAQAPEGRRSDDALILMGKAFFELRRYIQAESSFQKLLDTQPKSKFRDDAIYFIILINLEREDVGLADLSITRLLDEYPKSSYRPVAQLRMGEKLVNIGETDRALEVLSGVRDNYPKFDGRGEVLSLIARIYFDNKDYASSLPIYEMLYKDGDNSAQRREGVIGMGRCTSNLGRHEEALKYYQAALLESRYAEERAEAQLGIDEEYVYLGRVQAALDGFEQIVEDIPRTEYSAAAWFQIGKIYKDFVRFEGMDSIALDSVALKIFTLNSKSLEPMAGLSQRLLAYKLAEMAYHKVRSEDPYSVFADETEPELEDVRDLYSIYEQIGASDSTSSADALARLEFLLAENDESNGRLELARARYERILFEYPNSIWIPKAALNAARTNAMLADSTRWRQTLQLVIENFPDTRYADRARRELAIPVPDRPPNFYLDELAAYTPPKIERKAAGAAGPGGALAPGARPRPGQESWLQYRRRLWREKTHPGGGA